MRYVALTTRNWRVTRSTCNNILVLVVMLMSAAGYTACPPIVQAQEAEVGSPDDAAQPTDERLDDIDLLTLDVPEVHLVYSATRRGQDTAKLPYAVSVITAEDIRRAGAQSVPEALRLAPGVDVARASAANYTVSIRGFHGFYNQRVLVLVDGRQIFDALFGGTAWYSWPFQVEDIERIEVVRGPGSAAWGANAVNGMINIVTKKPADQAGLTTTVRAGSYGSHKTHLGYAFADDKLQMRVSGEYDAHDGFRDGGSFLLDLDDNLRNGRVGLHSVYRVDEDDSLTFSAGSGFAGEWTTLAPITLFDTMKESSQSNYLLARWDREIAKDNTFSVIGFVNDNVVCAPLPIVDYRYQQLALQISHTFVPAEHHVLTWGIDTEFDLMDASNADPELLSKDYVTSALIGFRIEDEWRFAPKWALTLGGRADYDTYGGVQPSGRAALAYELTDDSMVWGAVSRAFLMPRAPIRFFDAPVAFGLARVQGTRSLEAEQLLAYEFGYRGHFLDDRLSFDLSFFWHEYSDMGAFKLLPGPPGLVRFDFDNRGSASTHGAEFETRYRLTDAVTLLGHYTYEQVVWRSSTPFRLGLDAIYPPKHKFMLGALYSPTDDLHLSSYLHYVDAVQAPDSTNVLFGRHIDPYFRLDLRAEYEFWQDRASVAVGVNNLLDNAHYEGTSVYLASAQVPRMVYAEFRLSFK